METGYYTDICKTAGVVEKISVTGQKSVINTLCHTMIE